MPMVAPVSILAFMLLWHAPVHTVRVIQSLPEVRRHRAPALVLALEPIRLTRAGAGDCLAIAADRI